MSEQTVSRSNAADHLETEGVILTSLDAALADAGNDPAAITRALAAAVRSSNVSKMAQDTGMSRAGIYKALSEGKNPTFKTVMKIAQALGLQITFQRA